MINETELSASASQSTSESKKLTIKTANHHLDTIKQSFQYFVDRADEITKVTKNEFTLEANKGQTVAYQSINFDGRINYVENPDIATYSVGITTKFEYGAMIKVIPNFSIYYNKDVVSITASTQKQIQGEVAIITANTKARSGVLIEDLVANLIVDVIAAISRVIRADKRKSY